MDRLMPNTEQLEFTPTLTEGYVMDLKFDDGCHRLWLSRCDTLDGEPYDNTVYLEEYDEDNGRWYDVGHYDGDNPVECLPGVTGVYFTDLKVEADRMAQEALDDARDYIARVDVAAQIADILELDELQDLLRRVRLRELP
jgi:hypothetical protein